MLVCLLLLMQVSNPEPTAEDFAAERDRDGIPYFRFNPADIHVGTTEVKAIKLVDMMIKTRQYLNQPEQIKKMERIVLGVNYLIQE